MFWYLFDTLPIDVSTYPPPPLLVSLGEMNEASVPVTFRNVKWLLFGAVNEGASEHELASSELPSRLQERIYVRSLTKAQILYSMSRSEGTAWTVQLTP